MPFCQLHKNKKIDKYKICVILCVITRWTLQSIEVGNKLKKGQIKMIKEIYDIVSTFITDKNVKVSSFSRDGHLGYTFIKYGLADYPYCLTIFAEAKAPQKCREKSYLSPVAGFVPGEIYIKKHYGEIEIKRGSGVGDGFGTRILLAYKTKHEVGTALDKTQSDIKRFFTRRKSPEFFKIVNMAEKRMLDQIPTTDNSAQLYNMIYRLKENQK